MQNSAESGFISVKLLGHEFLTGNELNFNQLIFGHLQSQEPRQLVLCHYNLHAVYLRTRDADMNDAMRSVKYAWIDGMPIIWMLKIMGFSVRQSWRLTFLDWQSSFFERANEARLKVFLLGTTAEAIDLAKQNILSRYKDISFTSHHGHFNAMGENNSENDQVISHINDVAPDILLLGMGMPLQEIWINQNNHKLSARVILPLGGYFDYIAGNTYTPPRWAGKLGLEWAFRFASSPRRLAFRYLIEPWVVVYHLLADLLKK